MNILYISKIFPEVRGVKWINTLKREKFNITVVCENYKNESELWDYETQVIEQCKKKKKELLKLIVNNNKSIDTIILRDIFQIKLAIKLKKMYKAILIVDIADNYPEVIYQLHPNIYGKTAKLYFDYLEKIAILNADQIVVVTNESKNHLAQKYSILKSKIFILRNMPSLDENTLKSTKFNKVNQKKDEIRMVYIGNFHEKIRDFHVLFEALKLNPNLILTIYSSQLERIHRFSKDYQFDRNQLFVKPPIKATKLYNELTLYDIGLVPHKNGEGTEYTEPNKLYDYIHAGIPVLVSDNLALKNTVDYLQVGCVYKRENAKDFVNKALEVIRNSELFLSNQSCKAPSLIWEKDFHPLMYKITKKKCKEN